MPIIPFISHTSLAMKNSEEESTAGSGTDAPYFFGRISVEAGSVVKHRNIRLWKNDQDGEWHAESLGASVNEATWSTTILTSHEKNAFIWRGSDVVVTGSLKSSERLTFERAIDAHRSCP